MSTKTTNLLLTIFILAAFAVGIVLYSQLPDQIASHWNAAGEADGYMNKFWGVFLLPFISIGLATLYWIVPKIDPLKANIESFRSYYNAFWILLTAFLIYLFGLMLVWNLGITFNFITAIVPAFSFLWFFIGTFLKKTKRNWFVGIRTPWTLSSDEVWEKTNRICGMQFQATAFVVLLGMFFPRQILWFMFPPLLAIVLFAAIYSYIEYKLK